MCMRIWESRTLKADCRSVAARQERSRRGGCCQRGAECEHRSSDSDEPKPEIEVVGAGRAGASADAFEISPPAIWSARLSRDTARSKPLYCLPARLRLSRCQIRLGEHPTPADLSTGAAVCWGETRRGAVRLSPVGSLGALVVFMSLIVACCAVLVKSFSKKFARSM